MMMLQNSADAEDAVQNVFLKFVEKGQEFHDEEHENAWFITVTKNYCKKHNLSTEEFLKLDDKYAILNYVAECPDIFDSLS